MSVLADEFDGLIPLGVASCCREWLVPVGVRGGRCGLCNEVPTFLYALPKDHWLKPAAPRWADA